MKLVNHLLCLAICIISFLSCSSVSRLTHRKEGISPYEYGLATAKTGVDKYQVLLNTHRAAVKAGVNVDYSNIDTIRLEVPENPSRIPLTTYNDFNGCVFMIKNSSKDVYLFEKSIIGNAIVVNKQLIDKGDFRSVDALKSGRNLLVIEDKNPWVQNRRGHDYGHTRKDIMLIENGEAKNTTTMPYNNKFSEPICTYIHIGDVPLVMKNLVIEREPDCANLTHIAFIRGVNDVRISDVIIHTPTSNLMNDRGILIRNCTNVTLDNIHIDGTYSQVDHSGYGICLDNVWNVKATRLFGKANWGIFGNNNVNTAYVENSQINRFDIHCYGRDISFKSVDFFDHYNQYSSVYGTIQYDKCSFTDFVPVLNGGSYNAYVKHDLLMRDCVFNVTPNRNYILNIRRLDNSTDARYELSEKCLPNVYIKNLVVNMTGGAERLYLFYCTFSGERVTDIGYVSNFNIDGLTINADGEKPLKEMLLSNKMISTKQPIDCKLTNVQVNQPVMGTKAILHNGQVSLKTNITVNGDMVTMKNVKNLKQQ